MTWMAQRYRQKFVFLQQFKPKKFNPLLTAIKKRSKRRMDTRIITEGEAGIGKSYFAMWLAEMLDPDFKKDPKKAVEEKVFFSAAEYLKAVVTQPIHSVLIYDEAGQSWHHREFMSEANLILSKTMIGYRFKRFITILCVPTIDMIDKDARSLTQYLVNVTHQGEAEIYRTIAQKFGGPSMYGTFVHKMLIPNIGKKLRVAYEKKKRKVQDELYDKFHKQLVASDAPTYSNTELQDMVLKDIEKYSKNGTLSAPLIAAKENIGYNRAATIKAGVVATLQEESG